MECQYRFDCTKKKIQKKRSSQYSWFTNGVVILSFSNSFEHVVAPRQRQRDAFDPNNNAWT